MFTKDSGWPVVLVLALGVGLWRPAPAAAGRPSGGSKGASAGEGIEVLGDRTIWRFHISYHPRSGQCRKARQHSPRRWVRWGEQLAAPFPPAGWIEADFDDSGWPRRRGPFLGGYGGRRWPGAALVCLRGRFGVTDPANAGPLTLRLVYRGGAVVYVNGQEAARLHLPPGRIGPLTPAEPYPPKAYVTPDGRNMLPEYGRRKPPPELLDRYEARIRRRTVAVPPRLLRKGTNVLAVELHRTAPPTDLSLPADLPASRRRVNWDTVGLLSATLTAAAGSAVVANPSHASPPGPRGVELWNASPLLRVGLDADYGDPFEPLGPVRLMAPINGTCSGQVVVGIPEKMAPPAPASAKVSDLLSAGGAVIPAAAVRVRYARLSRDYVALLDRPLAWGANRLPLPDPRRGRRGKAAAEPPPGRHVQPIWLTVKVPPDAAPGRYTGRVTIEGLGRPVTAAVELTVYAWKLGDPPQWKTFVNLLQSPESVAGHYKVPLWSDRHFELMAATMKLMGRAGNDLLGISAVGKNVFGDDPVLVFRKTGPGRAGYEPELKFLRRYLELYDRRAGRPKLLCLHVWTYGMYQRGAGRDGGKLEKRRDTIPVVELRGGELVAVEVPIYGEPGTERMWRPAMDGLRKIVNRLGWGERCVLLGTSGDGWPSPITVEFFKRIAPYARWRAITHGSGVPRWGPTERERTQPNGMVVGYCEAVRRITNARTKVPGCPLACNSRDCVRSDPLHFRALPGVNTLSANFNGFCWKGMDYWTYTAASGRKRSALNTYVHFGNIVGSTPRTIVAPGPDGAVATVQYEMLREGIQDCEAMLLIDEALTDPALRAKLGADLANRCEEALEDLLCLLETGARYAPHGGGDVRRHVRRLYAAAADAAKAIGAGK